MKNATRFLPSLITPTILIKHQRKLPDHGKTRFFPVAPCYSKKKSALIRYTSRTVSYAKELTSVYICYSQGNGLNTPLSIFYILYTKGGCFPVAPCYSKKKSALIRYTSRTVSYAKELTSVYICYSQGNGLNTPLSIFYILYTKGGCSCCCCSFSCGLLRRASVINTMFFVCTLSTFPRINRPPI